MKILVVTPLVDLSTVKGDSIHLQKVLGKWAESHEVYLISATPENQLPIDIAGHTSITTGVGGKLGAATLYGKTILTAIKVASSRDFDLVYERHGFVNTGYFAKTIAGAKYVVEVNGIPTNELSVKGDLEPTTLRGLRLLERLGLSLADQIVCVSPRISTQLSEMYGLPDAKISVVQNGVDSDLFYPVSDAKRQLGWDDSRRYVGFVGSLKPWHGLEQLIASLGHLSACDVTLVVIGDGPMREQLERTAETEGVTDDVVFVGKVPHDEVPTYLSALDAGVVLKHPRIQQSPLKMFEYLACGTPVVATDDADLYIVEERNVGTMVEYGDPASIAAGIRKVLSSDADSIRSRARRVGEEQSWSNVAQRVLREVSTDSSERETRAGDEREIDAGDVR